MTLLLWSRWLLLMAMAGAAASLVWAMWKGHE